MGNQPGLAIAYNNLGWISAHLGQYEQELTMGRLALDLDRQLGDQHDAAVACIPSDTFISSSAATTTLPAAIATLCAFSVLWGARRYEATVLTDLGDCLHAMAGREEARDAWEQALTILDDLHHSEAAEVRDKLARLVQAAPPPALLDR